MKLAFVAGMVGFAILAWALGFDAFGQAAGIASILCGLGAFIHWTSGLKRRDRYDLNELRAIHEERENAIDEAELELYETTGKVVCLNCATEYDARLGSCPRCGKSQFG